MSGLTAVRSRKKTSSKKKVSIVASKSQFIDLTPVSNKTATANAAQDGKLLRADPPASEIKAILREIARNFAVLGMPLPKAVEEVGIGWDEFARWRARFHVFWKVAIEDAVEDDSRDTMRAVALRRNRIIDRMLQQNVDELIPETYLEILKSDAPSFIRMRAAKELAEYLGVGGIIKKGVVDGRDAIVSGRTSQIDPKSVEILHKSIGVVKESAEMMKCIAQASLERALNRGDEDE